MAWFSSPTATRTTQTARPRRHRMSPQLDGLEQRLSLNSFGSGGARSAIIAILATTNTRANVPAFSSTPHGVWYAPNIVLPTHTNKSPLL